MLWGWRRRRRFVDAAVCVESILIFAFWLVHGGGLQRAGDFVYWWYVHARVCCGVVLFLYVWNALEDTHQNPNIYRRVLAYYTLHLLLTFARVRRRSDQRDRGTMAQSDEIVTARSSLSRRAPANGGDQQQSNDSTPGTRGIRRNANANFARRRRRRKQI